jgi:hypothetical protein
VRVTIAVACDLAKRPAVYARFIHACDETIDRMYSDDAAINAFAKWADITPIMARRVRDGYYPKEMLQTKYRASMRSSRTRLLSSISPSHSQPSKSGC